MVTKIFNEDVGDDLRRVVKAINENCFNTELNQIPLHFAHTDDDVSLYDSGSILISKAYYDENGISDKLIQALFHVMIHAYCDAKGIRDTDGSTHLEAFADVCERHGGHCSWIDSQSGYGHTGVKVKKLKRIKADLIQRGA